MLSRRNGGHHTPVTFVDRLLVSIECAAKGDSGIDMNPFRIWRTQGFDN